MLLRVVWPTFRAVLLLGLTGHAMLGSTVARAVDDQAVQALVDKGRYDAAVAVAIDSQPPPRGTNRADPGAELKGLQPAAALARLLAAAEQAGLADDPFWQSLLHYKSGLRGFRSQVDAEHFFMSERGKQDLAAELNATLAALFATRAKPPLRLIPSCRFVARRQWLEEKLGDLAASLPSQECPEFDQYRNYLQADVLTLVFPSAYPNNPSSAFGHTLIRIDKQDQSAESRLLNMSINFAAEVPPGVSSAAYALKGLAGGFPGRYRLLPYHLKLREYGQIQNRDTWEYALQLDPGQVNLLLRHAYEMLIADFDYFFFSENCSYHLLSLLDVLFPENPLTDEFGLWTIPTDTIRLLEERGIVGTSRFVPSSVRTLRTRRDALPTEDRALALGALQQGVPTIDSSLASLPDDRQAAVLDLVSDYLRYERLQLDTDADGMNDAERAVLSRRSRLRVRSDTHEAPAPAGSPDQGHGTARVALRRSGVRNGADRVEFSARPAYHDFRDPSLAYGSKDAIELLKVVVAHDLDRSKSFLREMTLLDIESIEPRDGLFKPVSWHTRLRWNRDDPQEPHRFTFNVGAGAAFQRGRDAPIAFALLESDVLDDPAFDQRLGLQLGFSGGVHWEPASGFRTGLEVDFRRRIGERYEESHLEAWFSLALGSQWAVVIDAARNKRSGVDAERSAGAELRYYF